MKRRTYLSGMSVAIAGIAGCSSESNDDSSNGSDSNDTPVASDYIEILSYDFVPPEVGSGILLEITFQNVSDQDIDLVSFDGALFVDNERVDDASFSEGDVTAGTEITADMAFADATQYIDEITRYTISTSFRADGERIEDTYEYDDFEYP